MAVGIGSGVRSRELISIAKGSANVFRARSFRDLGTSAFVKKVTARTCALGKKVIFLLLTPFSNVFRLSLGFPLPGGV